MSQRPQQLFLQVVSPEVARERWWRATAPRPCAAEEVPLAELRTRVLAQSITAPVDVPGFDRSNVDGYAVVASDTYGASETCPRRLRLGDEIITTGVAPKSEVVPGLALTIATGGVIPRGADAVVMVEDTDLDPPGSATHVLVRRPAIPGAMISFAGSDITRGEVVLRPGLRLGSRETGVIAALGLDRAMVHQKPRVALLSTGDEIVAPGAPRPLGKVHDCNQTMLADSCAELGAEVLRLGILGDDLDALVAALREAIDRHRADLIVLSGGTSKGAGDLCVRALASLPGPSSPSSRSAEDPPIVVHGIAIKPGKPLCLAASRTLREGREIVVPLAILPGFPTSALFTFHEFVAPLLRALCGLRERPQRRLRARLPLPLRSERGRRQYTLVQLLADVDSDNPETAPPIALPLGKGSGSITAFARADGFIAIPEQVERLDAGSSVIIEQIDAEHELWDLLIVGSHCTGLERIAWRLHRLGVRVHLIAKGSMGGLQAVAAGLCDIAPIHLCDPDSGIYNRSFVPEGASLVRGYGRMQGLLSRPGDRRFANLDKLKLTDTESRREHPTFELPAAVFEADTIMVNRNRGSGTRVLIDLLLESTRAGKTASKKAGNTAAAASPRPRGYHHEARSHQGVAACVAQGRADWGIAIQSVRRGLDFAPIKAERYDFVIADKRRQRPAISRFLSCLNDPDLRAELAADGFLVA